MTYQEALDWFKQLLCDIDKNNDLFVGTINKEFVQTAISALEKQIPKKYIKESFPDVSCPNCHYFNEIGEYCKHCGQAIDWRK